MLSKSSMAFPEDFSTSSIFTSNSFSAALTRSAKRPSGDGNLMEELSCARPAAAPQNARRHGSMRFMGGVEKEHWLEPRHKHKPENARYWICDSPTIRSWPEGKRSA